MCLVEWGLQKLPEGLQLWPSRSHFNAQTTIWHCVINALSIVSSSLQWPHTHFIAALITFLLFQISSPFILSLTDIYVINAFQLPVKISNDNQQEQMQMGTTDLRTGDIAWSSPETWGFSEYLITSHSRIYVSLGFAIHGFSLKYSSCQEELYIMKVVCVLQPAQTVKH